MPASVVRRSTIFLILGAMLVAGLVGIAVPPAFATADDPIFERQIGGRGKAAVYPWGIQYNPVNDRVYVGDYWNFVVREWTTDGVEENAFFRPASEREGQPYTIGVDPRDGAVYVPEISDGGQRGHIIKYSADGEFLLDIFTDIRYIAWISVTDDGHLLVADSHYWNTPNDPGKIRKLRVGQGECGSSNYCEVDSWGEWGDGPGETGMLHGLGTDADGNVYAADATNNNVHVYSSDGTWLRDFGTQQSGPNDTTPGAFRGDLRGLAVDRDAGLVYVADSQAGQIEVFELDGTPVRNFGSLGAGEGQFADGARQLTVDGAGNVWATDYGNFRVHKFAADGELLATYPAPERRPADGTLAQPRDVAVDDTTGDVFVVETWNQRVQRFGADGSHLATRGSRNSLPPWGMNYPRGVAVNDENGDLWVANTRDHRLRVYDNTMEFKFEVGADDSASAGNFRWPMDLEIVDGRVYVSDYVSGRVKVLDAQNGSEMSSISRANQGLAVDPASGRVYVVGTNSRIYVYSSSLQYQTSFGGTGTGDGRFGKAWDADIVGDRIYVTDANRHKVEVFTLNGASRGSFGSVGSGARQLRNPSGIDHDAQGNLYIADAGNDRVQVWSTTSTDPADTTSPSMSLEFLSEYDPTSVMLTGSATDDVRMGTVELAVRNTATGQWWNSSTMSWQPGKSWVQAAWDGGTSSSQVTWSYDFLGAVPSGTYWVQGRARDAAGNLMDKSTWPSASVVVSDGSGDGGGEDDTALPAGVTPDILGVVGGNGAAEMYPSGLEIAPDGTIVVANTGDDAVQKYAADGTLLWRVGTSGSGDEQLNNPRDVGVMSDGTIHVADTGNGRMVILGEDGSWLGTYRGSGSSQVRSPIGVTVTEDQVIIADGGAKRVRFFDAAGEHQRSVGEAPGCEFAAIRDADVDADGNIYVANYTAKNVVKLSPSGECVTAWGSAGGGEGEFRNPYGLRVAYDPVLDEQLVYVNDSNNGRNQVFTLGGDFVGAMGQLGDPATDGEYAHSRRVAVSTDGSGDVWIADLWGWKIERFARTAEGWQFAQVIRGAVPEVDAEPFNTPRGIGMASSGRFWTADTVHHRVVEASMSGAVHSACGTRGWTPGNFNWPRAVAVDPATGNLWVTDTKQSRLQIVEPDCDPVARVGGFGSGAGEFNWPMGIVISEASGVAFVSDTNNGRVVAYDVATRAQIGAHEGLTDPRGLAIDPQSGQILVAEVGADRVLRLSFDGSAFSSEGEYSLKFEAPEAVAVDSGGRIWVADTGHDRITVLNPDGTHLGTLSGEVEGEALSAPGGMAADSEGRVVVSDTGSDRVLVATYEDVQLPEDPNAVPTAVGDFAGSALAEITAVDVDTDDTHIYAFDVARYRLVRIERESGQIDAELGGTFNPEPGGFAAARSIALASTGDVFVADTARNRIIRTSGDLTWEMEFGSYGDQPGEFRQVYGVAIGTGQGADGSLQEVLYTMDGGGPGGNGRIQRFDLDGTYLGEFASGTAFNQARMIAVHPETNDLWVVNARAREIAVFDVNGTERFRFGGSGSGDGEFKGDPRGLAIHPDGSRVYVSDEGNRRVQVFDDSGNFVREIGEGGDAVGQFTDPRGLDVAPDGTLVVADQWAHNIQEFHTSTGEVERRLFGAEAEVGGVNAPRGLAYNGVTGEVFNSDWWNQRVARWNVDGSEPMAWGYRGTREDIGSINFAWDVAVQEGTGFVYVANRESHEIEVFDHDGNYVTRWGNRGAGDGELEFPQGVAFDPTDGSLLVVDSQNHRIQRFAVSPAGRGTFVESYGSFGDYRSEPGHLNTPTGIDVAEDGTIWIADTSNNRIQKRTPEGTWSAYSRPSGGTAAESYALPRGVSVAPDGTVWFTDSGNDEIVKMDEQGGVLFAASGEDMGVGPFNEPFAIEFLPEDRILISDLWNNRIVEVTAPIGTVPSRGGDEIVLPTPMDEEAPDVTLATPQQDEVVTDMPVTISGVATDDVGVAKVEWAVRRTDSNEWWRSDGTWGEFAWLDAELSAPGDVESDFTASFNPGETDATDFVLTVRATDEVGKVDPDKPFVGFVLAADGLDEQAPQTVVTSPEDGATVPAGVLEVEGSVADDVGVVSVTIGVHDREAGTWLQPDGSWAADYAASSATLAAPGAPETTFQWTGPDLPEGSYGLSVKSFDEAGNVGSTWQVFGFEVPDEQVPELTVASPAAGAGLPAADPLVVTGTASDDVGVGQVLVGVRDRDSLLWLQPDGTWSESFANMPAELSEPGGLTSEFSWETDLPAGRYGIATKAFDSAGKEASDWRNIRLQ